MQGGDASWDPSPQQLSVVLAPIAETPPVMAGQPSLTLAHVPQKQGPLRLAECPQLLATTSGGRWR